VPQRELGSMFVCTSTTAFLETVSDVDSGLPPSRLVAGRHPIHQAQCSYSGLPSLRHVAGRRPISEDYLRWQACGGTLSIFRGYSVPQRLLGAAACTLIFSSPSGRLVVKFFKGTLRAACTLSVFKRLPRASAKVRHQVCLYECGSIPGDSARRGLRPAAFSACGRAASQTSGPVFLFWPAVASACGRSVSQQYCEDYLHWQACGGTLSIFRGYSVPQRLLRAACTLTFFGSTGRLLVKFFKRTLRVSAVAPCRMYAKCFQEVTPCLSES